MVEAGNFATLANDAEAVPRRDLMLDFYRDEHYDAVTLGEQELNNPISTWIAARDNGLPIIAANLFMGERAKKPLFEPYKLYERGGVRMAVVGLVPERAIEKSPDSTEVKVVSPYEQQKLMRKLNKRSDHMTIIGDFTIKEAESLAMAYPFVDLIVTSNPLVFKTMYFGKTALAACGGKGYYGDYLQMPVERSDSTDVRTIRETLDVKVPADTLYEGKVARAGIKARK